MKKLLKTAIYTSAWLWLVLLNSANAIDFKGSTTGTAGLEWTTVTLDIVIQNWLTYITWFAYFVAIAMMIWGGFNIITSWGAEDKAKKWKTVLIQASAWLIVIFLASSLINWIISILFSK